jgi:ABC-2 type transport system permease protein
MTGARLLVHQLSYEQRTFWRNRSGVFFTFVFPLILLVLIGGNADDEYRRFLIPGIAALALVGTAFQGFAITLSMHRDQGVLKRLRATPMPGSLLLSAKILSVALVVLVEMVIVTVAGRMGYDIGWPQAPATFAAICLVGGVAFCALGVGMASLISNSDSAPAVTNAVYLPMMFLSGIFYKVSEAPEWLQFIGKALPLYHLATPLRAAYVDGAPPHLLQHLVVLGAWGIAGAFYAIRRFRWAPTR